MTHAEISELLGAYALDAVDPAEARAVEEHLASCPRCRAEVEAHREVAAMLGNSGGEAPEGLWARIAAELEGAPRELPSAPSLGAAVLGRSGPRGGRRGRRLRPVALSLGAVAAALAVVVGLLAAKVGNLDAQMRTISSALAGSGVAEQAALAATDPSHTSVALDAVGGSAGRALIVALPSGQAYFVTRSGLRALSPDRTYQLWALASGRVVSLGLLGRSPRDVAVEVAPNMTEFMVTAEPSGGTTRPTSPVVVEGSVQ